MTKTPLTSPIAPPERPGPHEGEERLAPTEDALSLPGHIASSGALDRLVETALLHKSAEGRTAPYPGQTYPATFVTGMPSAV